MIRSTIIISLIIICLTGCHSRTVMTNAKSLSDPAASIITKGEYLDYVTIGPYYIGKDKLKTVKIAPGNYEVKFVYYKLAYGKSGSFYSPNNSSLNINARPGMTYLIDCTYINDKTRNGVRLPCSYNEKPTK